MVVVDASLFLAAAASPDGTSTLAALGAVAPPLLWPEARSALHTALMRRLISRDVADRCLASLHGQTVTARAPAALGREVWRIADDLGWTKTYDAEYLALARLARCAIATLDARMRVAAARLDIEVTEVA